MANDVFVQCDGWVEAWHAIGDDRGGRCQRPEVRTLAASATRSAAAPSTVLRVVPDAARLSQAAAESFVEIAQAAIAERGRFTVALAGGSTPKRLYELLAEPPYRDRVDWSRVVIFFGDERCVPPDHADSNFRMAKEIMMIRLSSLSAQQVHRMQAERADLDVAADDYAALIAHAWHVSSWTGDPPAIDLVLLGMGADGHTASLFPNTAALDEQDRWVVANPVPQLGTFRVTLTAPLLNAARQVMFLVAGQDKAAALADVLEGSVDLQRLPSQLIRPTAGGLTWLVDQAAAARLKSVGPR
ncbi:MAG: 6-phosphogluconolactonase [Planctomycetales bacterium]|nr:6-phosphogluconolactonase [Planctomycetales bacterium]